MSFEFDNEEEVFELDNSNLLNLQDVCETIAKGLNEEKERRNLSRYNSDVKLWDLLEDFSSAEYYRNKGYMSGEEDSLLTWDAVYSIFGVKLPRSLDDFIVETRDKFILVLRSAVVPSELRIFDPMSQLLIYESGKMMDDMKFYGSFSDRLKGKPIVALYADELPPNVLKGQVPINLRRYYHFLGVFKADSIDSSCAFALTKLWDRYWIPEGDSKGDCRRVYVYEATDGEMYVRNGCIRIGDAVNRHGMERLFHVGDDNLVLDDVSYMCHATDKAIFLMRRLGIGEMPELILKTRAEHPDLPILLFDNNYAQIVSGKGDNISSHKRGIFVFGGVIELKPAANPHHLLGDYDLIVINDAYDVSR